MTMRAKPGLVVTENCYFKMLATFTPLGIALRNTRVHSTSFERISIFTQNICVILKEIVLS